MLFAARFSLVVTLLDVSYAILDPRQLLDSLPSFNEFSSLREKHSAMMKDYPFGAVDFSCGGLDPSSGSSDVHHLSPADVRVVAALGDSLSAGYDALAEHSVDLGNEYRGVSFDAGGDNTLKERATLPNILRIFSPNVTGASRGVFRKRLLNPRSPLLIDDFNVAVTGATSVALAGQIDELVRRLTASHRVDMENDYKLITIFIGSNDLCDYSKNTTLYSPSAYHARIRAGLEEIRRRIPKSFVALLPPFNVFAINETHGASEFCRIFHHKVCPSLFALSAADAASLFAAYTLPLDDIADAVSSDSFAVTVVPALTSARMPQLWGTPNLAMMALDCFHFSALTHDVSAKLLWQNLLVPPGAARKTAAHFEELQLEKPACPRTECPYFHTTRTGCSERKEQSLRVLAGSRDRSSPLRTSTSPIVVLIVIAIFGVLAFATVSTLVRARTTSRQLHTAILHLHEHEKTKKNRKPSEDTPLLQTFYYKEYY